MKKSIYVILAILIQISCKSDTEINTTILQPKPIDELSEKQEIKKAEFDKKLLSILNFKYLESIELNKNQKHIRFFKTDAFQKDVSIIDIYDKNQYEITAQSISYSFDNDCHLLVGSGKLSDDCVTINSQKETKINEKEYGKLLQLLIENEIWDLKEKESEIFGYDGILYHGETWTLEMRYCFEPMHYDTTICKTQKLSRIFPEKFKGLYSVGNEIMKLVE